MLENHDYTDTYNTNDDGLPLLIEIWLLLPQAKVCPFVLFCSPSFHPRLRRTDKHGILNANPFSSQLINTLYVTGFVPGQITSG